MSRFWIGLIALLLAAPLQAHPLAPALLQISETAPDQYAVLWRTAVSRVQGSEVTPQMPATCSETSPRVMGMEDGEALVTRWRIRCAPPGLIGSRLGIRGLEGAGINVIFRFETLDGAASDTLLDATQSSFVLQPPAATPPVFGSYLKLGVEHLLTGVDHLLFVTGLLLLVRRLRPLLVTITAFTLGHSLTLALATLGLVHVPQALAELGIAISILVLAVEVSRPAGQPASALARRPWLMAAGFGLLHGLGFAGALAEVGLPAGQIARALLAFNIGIELAQLLWVAALLAVAWACRPWWKAPSQTLARVLPAYVIGTLAAYWCWQRFTALWT